MPRKRSTWDPSQTAAANAASVLPALAAAYFRAGRAVLKRTAETRELHRLRLATKRFRYTLELFCPCYGAALGRRLDALRQIQSQLGDISDCYTTRRLIDRMRAGGTPINADAAAFIDARVARRFAEFRAYWLRTFDAPREEATWKSYLGRFAGRSKPNRR